MTGFIAVAGVYSAWTHGHLRTLLVLWRPLVGSLAAILAKKMRGTFRSLKKSREYGQLPDGSRMPKTMKKTLMMARVMKMRELGKILRKTILSGQPTL